MSEKASTQSSCGIAVMAKASQAGRTKTRLSPPLTLEEAAQFNTVFLKDIADNLLRASEIANIAAYMAFGPSGAQDFFQEHLPQEIGLLEVWYPDFGKCLTKALFAQFEAGHHAACVLNSDSPTLPAELLAEAAIALTMPGERIVLGPSNDGGYYLLGCKTIYKRLFEDIAWSTAAVTSQTLDRARELGLSVYLLPEWYDVDDHSALSILAGELLEDRPFHRSLKSSPARHSRSLLKSLQSSADLAARLQKWAHPPAHASHAIVSGVVV